MSTTAPAPRPEGEHLLDPALPYDMKPRARAASRDLSLQQFVRRAAGGKDHGRVSACRGTFGDRYDDVRRLAGAIKQHTLDHLDHYLRLYLERAEANGVTVHVAEDAAAARRICLEIADAAGARTCIKSKSMVTEEIHLLPALEAAGIATVETDLGEFILQIDGDAPSHIVTPMIHKDRSAVARAFQRELGAEYTEDAEALTMIARAHLRDIYRAADLGISGGNFLVAEDGALVICTNEGNADFCVSGPRTHIAMVGIEKLVPRRADLSVLLKLLARSGTAQPLTVYTTLIAGPRRAPEADGPEAVHVILVDNRRTAVLAEDSRELLRCIRCGACLNACPVYRSVGGHAYGAVYSGPIGAVLTPALRGLENYPDLPKASSLCGACFEACPVHIDIPAHLVRLREQLVRERHGSALARFAYRAWATTMLRPRVYRIGQRGQRRWLRLGAAPATGDAPYADRRWRESLPGPLAGWTRHRAFPAPPSSSFRDWWRSEGRP